MTEKRLSTATRIDVENGTIHMMSAGLLDEGIINGTLCGDNEADSEAAFFLVDPDRYKRYGEVNEQLRACDTDGISDWMNYVEHKEQWANHLFTQEKTVRYVECSLASGKTPSKEVMRAIVVAQSEKSPYRFDALSDEDADVVIDMTEYYLHGTDDDVVLGDVIAKERVWVEQSMVTAAARTLQKIIKGDKTLDVSYARAVTRRGLGPYDSDSIQGMDKDFADVYGVFNKLSLKRQRLHLNRHHANGLGGVLSTINNRRFRDTTFPLGDDAHYRITPGALTDYEVVDVSDLQRGKMEQPHFRPTSEERIAALAVQRALEAESHQQKQREADQLNREHDAPIIAHLNEIARQHNGLIQHYIGQSNKSLRKKGLVGRDSLEYELSKHVDIDAMELHRAIRTYDRLCDMAIGQDADAQLTLELEELERLQSEYLRYDHDNPRKTALTPNTLAPSIKDALYIVTNEWTAITEATRMSNHQQHIDQQTQLNVAIMLGLADRPVDAEKSINGDTPVERANQLAEQLRWVVLPDEHVSSAEVVDVVKESIARSGDNSKEIESYRIEALLRLREMHGGTLYRSDTKMLGDNENLYFVLRFQHLGDDNFYAIAENPVKGNATYILREDILPLQPGETALTAVQLSRRDVREFGAKRVIHSLPRIDMHLDKVERAIEQLASE